MGLCHVTQRPSGPSRALCRALTDLSSGKKQDLGVLVPQPLPEALCSTHMRTQPMSKPGDHVT